MPTRPPPASVGQPKLDPDPGPPTEYGTLVLGEIGELPPQIQASYTLTVVEGPDQGQVFTLDGVAPSRALLGQGPACEIRLSDGSVSRRHAALDLAGVRLRLTDLGSTNGTFVDGVAILDAFLRGGELVRVGSTALRVEHGAPAKGPPLPATNRFGRVLGTSAAMRRLYPLCERLAASLVPVVIEGETGTGKEALAEALHEAGPRAQGPFVVFDCTAVPENLLESELFGHERGAFTGAVTARKGVFEQAHGGTLLIDEIGDLDLALQPKLLRAIERCEVRRVGGQKAQRVDVRLLAATRRDLDHEVAAGRFRDDLFHRLAVARIELPPLRRRKGDITVLARHFARELGGTEASLSSDLLRRWEDSPWPGNVRELRNRVARHIALGDLSGDHPARSRGRSEPPPADAPDAPPPAQPTDDLVARILAERLPLPRARQRIVDEFERRYIARVLEEHGGNIARAAAASGIARRYFQLLKARR